MKPIIGITVESVFSPDNLRTRGELNLHWNYPEAVVKAGGLPFLIAPMADMTEVAQVIDGWLIPGGADIDASHFGQENHPSVEVQDPSRWAAEYALFQALDPAVPILGICYGCQFLNVVHGGDLIQHVPDVVGHERHKQGVLETVTVQLDTKLGSVVGNKPCGKSYHHQAVGALGKGLKVTALSADGIVEGLESIEKPWVVAVQWHPERTPEDDRNHELVKEFVREAAKYAERKRGSVP
jgi:putative glutamine amidotransferase